MTSENKLEKGRERGFLEFFSPNGLRIFEPEIILPFEEGNSNLQVLNIDQRKDLIPKIPLEKFTNKKLQK